MCESILAKADTKNIQLKPKPLNVKHTVLCTGVVDIAEVMFPGGSPHLVEPIYKNPTLSAPFNEQLAGALTDRVRALLPALNPGQKVRIVEIGSGSGGTSAVVMAALAAADGGNLAEHVDFLYTDISAQLVGYGRKTYGPTYSFARFKVRHLAGPSSLCCSSSPRFHQAAWRCMAGLAELPCLQDRAWTAYCAWILRARLRSKIVAFNAAMHHPDLLCSALEQADQRSTICTQVEPHSNALPTCAAGAGRGEGCVGGGRRQLRHHLCHERAARHPQHVQHPAELQGVQC